MNKIATDIEQSKRLAEILPLESADMYYSATIDATTLKPVYGTPPRVKQECSATYKTDVPSWSLTALLEVMPSEIKDNHFLTLEKETFKMGDQYCCCYEDCNANSFYACFSNEPIDACCEMIVKLKEKNLI